ncbi:putative E3 ubiquitin-protein ligase UNKL isoform X10 [Nycticebus coucang]|uniref:putative E3 ubiquitin-protein ligase UNKL isoform X10 n=1 Tax=Nycticebus coucang TaxID=9470 RepID=UPI00234C2026|nr:putative E3 ubiquitin-protein ligase UNKL isoform X10 [Nycticebus coucang]
MSQHWRRIPGARQPCAVSVRILVTRSRGAVSPSLSGSALDLCLGDVNVTSLEKDLEEHNGHDLGPTGLNGVPGSIWDFVSGSFSPSPSPVLSTGPTSLSASPNGAELARVRRQLDEAKRKIRQWEESWRQVKQACDAWQREAQEAKERARVALQKKEEVEAQVRQLQEELEGLGLSALPGLRSFGDIGALPLPELHSLQSQLRLDLEAVDGVIFHLHTKQCVACREQPRGAILQPCQHHVLCEPHVASAPECPYCEGQPLQW